MTSYRVNLEVFSGPLDLLLYLVKKEEVDIYDISITNITDQYLSYIEMLKSLDIELAGDFLVMAATLMQIKSAMLLPHDDPDELTDEDEDDPRAQLIRQLLEYKKFKDAANKLDTAAEIQSLRHSRPNTVIEKLKKDDQPELDMDQVSVWHLLDAFDTLIKATGRHIDMSHIQDETPIDVYQIKLLERLQQSGPMKFDRAFASAENRLELVGMFLGLLELIREGLVWAEQSDEHTEHIYLKALTDKPAEMAVNQAIIAREQEENGQPAHIPIVEIPSESSKQQVRKDSAEPLHKDNPDN